jgi:hypothetical protein
MRRGSSEAEGQMLLYPLRGEGEYLDRHGSNRISTTFTRVSRESSALLPDVNERL